MKRHVTLHLQGMETGPHSYFSQKAECSVSGHSFSFLLLMVDLKTEDVNTKSGNWKELMRGRATGDKTSDQIRCLSAATVAGKKWTQIPK